MPRADTGREDHTFLQSHGDVLKGGPIEAQVGFHTIGDLPQFFPLVSSFGTVDGSVSCEGVDIFQCSAAFFNSIKLLHSGQARLITLMQNYNNVFSDVCVLRERLRGVVLNVRHFIRKRKRPRGLSGT